MREIEYKVDDPFKGKVTMRIPKHAERMAMIRELNIDTKEGELKSSEETMRVGVDVLKRLNDHVVKVDVKYGKKAFKSLEDLEYYEEGNILIQKLTYCLMRGVPLGNG